MRLSDEAEEKNCATFLSEYLGVFAPERRVRILIDLCQRFSMFSPIGPLTFAPKEILPDPSLRAED